MGRLGAMENDSKSNCNNNDSDCANRYEGKGGP